MPPRVLDSSIVVPAVLPSSRKDLEEKIERLSRLPGVARIQIDVVDGKFAAPACWPYNAPGELERLVQEGELLPQLDSVAYEIDLMCLDAERAVDAWLSLGASRFTFHAESIISLPHFFKSLHTRHAEEQLFSPGPSSFGLALNVTSDLALIEPYLEHISYVQFMGIAQIGKQGQPFDRRVLERVRAFHARYPEVAIQVDGGVSLDTAKELIEQGVSQLIVGSALLRAKDPVSVMAAFHTLQTPPQDPVFND